MKRRNRTNNETERPADTRQRSRDWLMVDMTSHQDTARLLDKLAKRFDGNKSRAVRAAIEAAASLVS